MAALGHRFECALIEGAHDLVVSLGLEVLSQRPRALLVAALDEAFLPLRDRFLVHALARIHLGQELVDPREARVDLERLLELLDRLVVTPGPVVGRGQSLVCLDRQRIALRGAPDLGEGLFPATRGPQVLGEPPA